MTTYYTGKGDHGSSNSIGGARLYKDDTLFNILGDMDELNSYIAVSLLYIKEKKIRKDLDLIQDQLFSISAILASTYSNANIKKVRVPGVGTLESEINRLDKELPELRKFVIPGGSKASSYLHVARAIARRVERKLVSFSKKHRLDDGILKYANRLSSFLFVAALYMNHVDKIKEKSPRYI